MAGIQHWYQHQQSVMAQEQINPSYQAIQRKQQEKAAELAARRTALAIWR